ncbi:hypothetical protein CAOG_009808 [Capsaspora owczarzaki ATCC 30864]|uniref:Uncharacterized protein n=1 Tax=Capsaspora owczarzaki (strain ATCC 30864) TaxID=595528 RepID=A0A0D2WSB6_CAPO3|nr:hypothetical protein CAOG_009808 [Capsaspora owczarzaki ATCC 30864]
MRASLLFALFFALLACFAMLASSAVVDQCTDVTTQSTCSQDKESDGLACVWCIAAAVPSFCANTAQAAKLPPTVFNCSTSFDF